MPLRQITPFGRELRVDEIIGRLGGGDQTKGSCSSLAFAYIGNIAGYDVLDFRGGKSCDFFSSNSSIQKILELPDIDSTIIRGKDDIRCANALLNTMILDKEYYLATGEHASIVRKNGRKYEYLELQTPNNNGWKTLDDKILKDRFGCRQMNGIDYPNFLASVDSLANNQEFLDILGYINTEESQQGKGDSGYAR